MSSKRSLHLLSGVLVGCLPLIGFGCEESPAPADTTAGLSDTASEDAGGDASTAPARGLPEGTSLWGGRFEVEGAGFLADLTLVNTGGDLTATVTFDDDPEASTFLGRAVYTLTGTHEPRSGRLVLAPQAWTEEPSRTVDLLGFEATYDPGGRTLTGMVVDFASGPDNTQTGGAGVFTFLSGDGAPTAPGDRARGLSAGAHTFFGSIQCTGPMRSVSGTFDYDGEGGIDGQVIVGGPSIEEAVGTFTFVGVHNPDTGAITLEPRLWLAPDGDEPLNFFVEGAYDPLSGRFDGNLRTNTNACPTGPWNVEIAR
jgi:hypothetical protein